jgi:hypothetical protein
MNSATTGIDRRDQTILMATTEIDSGRIAITGLGRVSMATTDQSEWPESGRVRLAVPESDAVVKPIVIESGDAADSEERIRFEMLSSMLEDEDQFLIATQPTGDDGRHLGMILRRDRAAELCASFGGNHDTDRDRLSFQLRSVGLGVGYLTFCRKEEAELVCLVDLAGDVASICLVHGNHIVDVASLATAPFDLDTESGREQFAVDLKTVINFRQVALTEAGISVPLSSLLLVGGSVDDDFRRIIQTYFPVGVRTPRIHDGFLSEALSESAESLPLFLVALGLAVN